MERGWEQAGSEDCPICMEGEELVKRKYADRSKERRQQEASRRRSRRKWRRNRTATVMAA